MAYAGRLSPEKGVDTLLAGDGGDELFAGYDPFRALRAAEADVGFGDGKFSVVGTDRAVAHGMVFPATIAAGRQYLRSDRTMVRVACGPMASVSGVRTGTPSASACRRRNAHPER